MKLHTSWHVLNLLLKHYSTSMPHAREPDAHMLLGLTAHHRLVGLTSTHQQHSRTARTISSHTPTLTLSTSINKLPKFLHDSSSVAEVREERTAGSNHACSQRFFFCYQGGRTPTGWPHTAQSGEPDCRGPEAKPHQRDTPNTPIPGGAQCPDQSSVGVEPTHLLGVLQRLPA
jgi:hypothetical protein